MYSGLQPAITALMAIFSTVAWAQRGGTEPITSCPLRLVPASMASTRSSVGGMIGNPSLQPFSSTKACAAQMSSGISKRSAESAADAMYVTSTQTQKVQVLVSNNLQPETRNLKPETKFLRHLCPRLGREKNVDQLVERRISAFDHIFQLHRADRMLDDEHRMIRRAKSLALGFCQRIEGVRDHRDRESRACL